jgi:hypothetical protein
VSASSPLPPLSGIIITTVMLTVMLISSPTMTVFSSLPMTLKVDFASASASEDDEEESGIDAATDGEENGGGNDEQQQGVQEKDAEEQEQFATVIGEICDDFEDNDGDGLIDLADADCTAPLTQGTVTAPTTTPSPPPSVINSTATNSTNNTLTASEITTREITTPSTDEASEITTGNTVTDEDGRPVYDLEKDCQSYEELGIPPPPLGFGQPPDAKWYHCPPGVGVWVAPNGTTSLGTGGEGGQQGLAQGGGVQGQQQQQQPNSPSSCPPQPTNYYYAPARIINVQLTPLPSQTTTPCPPGESSSAAPPPTTTTTSEICDDFVDNDGDGYIDYDDNDCAAPSTLGAITAPPGQQGEQPPSPPPQEEPGVEICDDFEDNDGDGFIDLVDADCVAPLTQGTVTAPTTPPPTSVTNTTATNVSFPDGTNFTRRADSTMNVNVPYGAVTADKALIDYHPNDGTIAIAYSGGPDVPIDSTSKAGPNPYTAILIKPDNTVTTLSKKDNTFTIYNPDGSTVTKKSDDTVVASSTPDDAQISSFLGSTIIVYRGVELDENGLNKENKDGPTLEIVRTPDGVIHKVIFKFPDGTRISKSLATRPYVSVSFPSPDPVYPRMIDFLSDGTIDKIGPGGTFVLNPDNTARALKPDGTWATYTPP